MKAWFALCSCASVVVACSGAGDDSTLGTSRKALMGSREIVPAHGECPCGSQHPSVCCEKDACYAWIDDPLRACEPGFTPIVDGSRCCSPADRRCSWTPPLPLPQPKPKPPYPEPSACAVP